MCHVLGDIYLENQVDSITELGLAPFGSINQEVPIIITMVAIFIDTAWFQHIIFQICPNFLFGHANAVAQASPSVSDTQ